jgi:hypothetical protein
MVCLNLFNRNCSAQHRLRFVLNPMPEATLSGETASKHALQLLQPNLCALRQYAVQICYAMLCYVMLCCVAPSWAVLCCAALSCAVLCHAVLCCAVLCCAVLCCAVLCFIIQTLPSDKGGLAGSIAWWSVYPLDVIKSRIQASSKADSEYKGTKRIMPF